MTESSEVVGARDRLVSSDEDAAVNQPRQRAADERANPVDPVAGEVPTSDSGSEGAGRVHRPAAEGPSGEDVGADDEPDRNGRDGAERALPGVSGGGVDRVHERECDDDLHEHAFDLAQTGGHAVRGNRLPWKTTTQGL